MSIFAVVLPPNTLGDSSSCAPSNLHETYSILCSPAPDSSTAFHQCAWPGVPAKSIFFCNSFLFTVSYYSLSTPLAS
jgi:hypothetical protein